MSFFDKIRGSLVLVQLSGGKDSIAALHMLVKNGIECRAVNFTHDWGYSIPTSEAEKICKMLGVTLEKVDITEKLSAVFLNDFRGRPCRACKGIMDRMTVEYAQKINASFICTGDSKSDRTLFRRLKGIENIENLYINDYFNAAFVLPEDIKIFRPLAEMDNDEVFDYLAKNDISVRRVGDTGDKYFEYSREGCPLQFKDYGAVYTRELMDQLKIYNERCSAYASKHGFKASVHLPSRYIITIPEGHSDETARNIGIAPADIPEHGEVYSYVIFLVADKGLCVQRDVLDDMIRRLCERMELTICGEESPYFLLESGSMSYSVTNDNNLTIHLISVTEVNKTIISNMITELFHTDCFKISTAFSRE